MTIGMDASGLRERNTSHDASTPEEEEAKQTVQILNAKEFHSGKASKDKLTFGRTPDGIGM